MSSAIADFCEALQLNSDLAVLFTNDRGFAYFQTKVNMIRPLMTSLRHCGLEIDPER